jgi:proline racemase
MARFKHVISTIDSHTAGEPTRLVVSGLPPLRGVTMAERMLHARQEMDGLRRLLLLEPRGRSDLYGALLTTSIDPAADFGLIFMNTARYTTMCGHAVIGAATTVVETGMVAARQGEIEIVFETPVGLVPTRVRVEGGRACEVSFRSTPAFVYQHDTSLTLPEAGEVPVDIVYSGGFFALVPAEAVGVSLASDNLQALADWGARVREAAARLTVRHPELPFMRVVDAVHIYGPADREADGGLRARNASFFGERAVDRSPCGTGTCARMAALHSRGLLGLGQPLVSEGIIGTRFVGEIVEETRVGNYPAIVARVAGQAYLTGFHQFVLDPGDPFPEGISLTGSAADGEIAS